MKKENKWIVCMLIITFVLSMLLGGASNSIVQKLNVIMALVVLIVIVTIGILFDIVGMAVATCDEAPFHAKAAKKIKGAKETIRLLRVKDRTTNFCNDLMGDMCGIISGSISALISVKISESTNMDVIIVSLITSAIVASITVGGKAFGKNIGIKHAEDIMEFVGKIVNIFAPVKDKNNRP